MKVLPIQPFNYSLSNKIVEPQTENKEQEPISVPESNIYPKGLSVIHFGHSIGKSAITNFEKEIAEQPKVIENLIKKYFSKPNTINMDLNVTKQELQKIKRIHIYASGSSKNASEMARNFIERITEIPTIVKSSSEAMCELQPFYSGEDLAIFVSQSGETADTLSVLNNASISRVPTIAITNNSESTIAKKAGSHVYLDAGEEKAVAATKTVTSSIFNLMVIGMKLGEIKGTLDKTEINNLPRQIANIPYSIRFMLREDEDVKKAAEKIAEAENIYYYAKGSSVGAAKEGALKLTETTGKRVIADASGEALHGTFASIKPENVVLQIIDFDTKEISKPNIEEIIRKRAVMSPIIMQNIGEDRTLNIEGIKPTYIEFPYIRGINDITTPLFTTIKFQQITNEVTKILGINPDNGGGFLTKFRQNINM